MRDWWKPYEGKIVGYVIEKNGKFTPYLASCFPDGEDDRADDCVLVVQGSGPQCDGLVAALEYFETSTPGIEIKEIFDQPIRPGMVGISWLIEPYLSTHKVDPRTLA